MLAPQDRQLFLDLIRPPDGYQFDCALGTTFTLDLYTLLATPLSLSLYDRDSLEQALGDPLVVLDSLRRCAERMTLFCQAGYIQIPEKFSPLIHYLEPMVVEVAAPRGGVFHPKIWLLRYTAANQSPVYRLVNLSRNLTADRSWDLALCLDGQLGTVDIPSNQPLVEFIRSLPELAVQPIAERTRALVESLCAQLTKVQFAPPVPFDAQINFYAYGVQPCPIPLFEQVWDRLLVVSPFLSESFLQRLSQTSRTNHLIASLESLGAISSDTRQKFQEIYHLDDLSNPDDAVEPAASDMPELTGLHAKLFVAEAGERATWLLGSANATEAAFNNNVEFMVGLTSSKRQVGIEQMLSSDAEDVSFMALLRRYEPPETRELLDDTLAHLDNLVNAIRRWLVGLGLRLQATQEAEDQFDLHLLAEKYTKPPRGQYEIACWPITMLAQQAIVLTPTNPGIDCCFSGISLVGLTSFMAFSVKAQIGRKTQTIRFSLRLPLAGLPERREQAWLAAVIADPNQFLRYLRMLLGSFEPFSGFGAGGGGDPSGAFIWKASDWEDLALLEDLVRALSRSPEHTIDRIQELVDQLKHTVNGQSLIPPQFEALWQVVIQARQALNNERF